MENLLIARGGALLRPLEDVSCDLQTFQDPRIINPYLLMATAIIEDGQTKVTGLEAMQLDEVVRVERREVAYPLLEGDVGVDLTHEVNARRHWDFSEHQAVLVLTRRTKKLCLRCQQTFAAVLFIVPEAKTLGIARTHRDAL